MELDNLAITFIVGFVVVGMLLVPVGIKMYNQADDLRVKTVTVDEFNEPIAPSTVINTTEQNATENWVHFDIIVNGDNRGSYNQSLNEEVTYDISGYGNLRLKPTAIGANEPDSTFEVAYDDLYGSTATTRTIFSNIVPVVLVALILAIIWMVKRT